MPIFLSRAMSRQYADDSNVSIVDLLAAIHCFHESGECLGHPHLELHGDGSGTVVEPRTKRVILQFQNLKQLVKFSQRLMFEYDIEWIDD